VKFLTRTECDCAWSRYRLAWPAGELSREHQALRLSRTTLSQSHPGRCSCAPRSAVVCSGLDSRPGAITSSRSRAATRSFGTLDRFSRTGFGAFADRFRAAVASGRGCRPDEAASEAGCARDDHAPSRQQRLDNTAAIEERALDRLRTEYDVPEAARREALRRRA
jgi:hypothetical protein